jgi:hypothetical protein
MAHSAPERPVAAAPQPLLHLSHLLSRLISQPPPASQDVYSTVTDAVAQRVAADAALGKSEASKVVGQVDRKLVRAARGRQGGREGGRGRQGGREGGGRWLAPRVICRGGKAGASPAARLCVCSLVLQCLCLCVSAFDWGAPICRRAPQLECCLFAPAPPPPLPASMHARAAEADGHDVRVRCHADWGARAD